MENTKIILTETLLTNICKNGFFTYSSKELGTINLYFTKIDIDSLRKNEIVTKSIEDFIFDFKADERIEDGMINEIIKRSPLFSDLVIR